MIQHIATDLLNLTRELHGCVSSGQLEPVEALQARRVILVAALDEESQKPHPYEALAACREQVEEIRQLEQEIEVTLKGLRDQVRSEYAQLTSSKEAIKAYDKFR